MKSSRCRVVPAVIAACLALLCGTGGALLATCGPFTDVAGDAFCPFVLEIFYLGITTGTTATTYDPSSNVSRLQMAAFLSRTVDGVLKRGSRRAALDQFWTPQGSAAQGVTTIGGNLSHVVSDGADLWVANTLSGTVARVRASDAKLLETWTGAFAAVPVLAAMGKVFAASDTSFGYLFRIDPSQPAGAVTTVATNLGPFTIGLAFDGARIWAASFNASNPGLVSIVTPGASIPWTVTTVTVGTDPAGAIYDGANVWIADYGDQRLRKLDAAGAVLQTVTVGVQAQFPVFDGSNIWVPNFGSDSLTVVRASNGTILTTLTGNGLGLPTTAAFDGQRVLVTNGSPASVSIFKAADLTPLGSFPVAADPYGACSDGINFWITMQGGRLVRF